MSTAKIEVDVAVIGAGTAGLVAHRKAKAEGAQRVLLIEGGPYGTTCARVGCMPSKLLIAAAERANAARTAGVFGIEVGSVHIDGAAVMDRVRRERDRFVASVVDSTQALPGRERLCGWARFVGPTTLIVETEAGEVEVATRTSVIATGSTPYVPKPLHGAAERLLTSDTIFELPELPDSLAVIGTGVIGLELAGAMHNLGVRTRVFDIGTRMPLLHSDAMQDAARELFGARLDQDALQLGISNLRAEQDGDVALRWTAADGSEHEDRFSHVLAATGRRPALARLGLEHADIELDDRGIPVGWDPRTTQIGDAPLFLAGDVTGLRPVLHEAAGEGRIAGANAAHWPKVRAHVRQLPLMIMFSDPQVAIVGEIPSADTCGCTHEFGEVNFAKQGRARVIDEAHGRVRIYANRDCGELVGAELIGPGVEHLAHLLAWAIERRVTAREALRLPYYHPVLEEGLRTAIGELSERLKHAEQPAPLDCGPGA